MGDDEDGVFGKQANTSMEEKFFNTSQREIVNSKIDAHDWRLELERVGPRLRKAKNLDSGWNSRLENTKTQSELINEYATDNMEGLNKQISDELSRIKRGEDNVKRMSNVESLVNEYTNNNVEMPETKEKFEMLEKSLAETSNVYGLLSDEVKELKEELNKRGESMSDTKQLVDIKKTIKTVGGEISEMEMRLGVLMHSVWGRRMVAEGDGSGGDDDLDDDDDDEC